MLASLLPNKSFESQLLKDIVCSFLKDNNEMRKCLNLSHPDCLKGPYLFGVKCNLLECSVFRSSLIKRSAYRTLNMIKPEFVSRPV